MFLIISFLVLAIILPINCTGSEVNSLMSDPVSRAAHWFASLHSFLRLVLQRNRKGKGAHRQRATLCLLRSIRHVSITPHPTPPHPTPPHPHPTPPHPTHLQNNGNSNLAENPLAWFAQPSPPPPPGTPAAPEEKSGDDPASNIVTVPGGRPGWFNQLIDQSINRFAAAPGVGDAPITPLSLVCFCTVRRVL